MPYLEFEDKNVDKAVSKACESLKIAKDKLRYEVVSYGSTGIFGLVGTKKAKIRVTVPDGGGKGKETKPVRRMDQDTATQVKNLIDEAFQDFAPKKEPVQADSPPPVLEETPPEAPVPAPAAPSPPPASPSPPPAAPSPPPEAPAEPDEAGVDPAVLAGKGEVILQRMVEAICTEEGVRINVDISDSQIVYTISEGNAAVLIGKKGQTLEAMQYLVDKIINQETDRRIKVLVDVDGYLAKRESSLKKLSGKLANRVKRTGKPITMSLMNAHERRVVHLSLKEDRNVRTQSKGEGYYRKLVILPKKGAPRRKKAPETGEEN